LRPRALDAIVEGVALWYAWQAAIVVRAIIPTSHHTRADLFVAGYKLHPPANHIFESTVFVCWKFCLARALNWLDLCAKMLTMVRLIMFVGNGPKINPTMSKQSGITTMLLIFHPRFMLGDFNSKKWGNKQKLALFLIILTE